MSKLDELIQQLCPDGVEWTRLIDIAYVQYGYPFDSNLFSDDNKYIPLIRIRDVKPAVASTYYSGTYDTMFIIKKGDILVGMDGNFNLEKWNDRDGLLNQRVCKICTKNESTVTNGYLYHLLKPLFKKIEDDIEGSTVKHLSAKAINQIYIPSPPLPVQEEIVRLLDQLTETTQKYQAKLEAELDARKKQYEEYRDQLLSFDASRTVVEWNILGESCNIIKGEYITKKETTAGNIPVILGGQEPAYYIDKSNHEGKGIVISRSGASAGYVSFWDEPIFVTDGFLVEPKDETLLIEFLYYFLKNKQPYIQSLKRGAGVPHITSNHISDLKVIIPPLDEQERIVNILDRMDKTHKELCQSIETEIKMRKQQYEYYRDKLLTLKKKEE